MIASSCRPSLLQTACWIRVQGITRSPLPVHTVQAKLLSGYCLLGKQPRLILCKSDGRDLKKEHTHTQLQPLDTGDEAVVGPRGLLLMGLTKTEEASVRAWFHQMEPGFPVCSCTDAQLGMSLREAVTADDGGFRIPQDSGPLQEKVPRLALLSGLTAEETLAIVDYWEHIGIALPIFASTVDAAMDKELRKVVLEVAESYAGMKAGGKERLDSSGLRAAIRQKMEEKRLQKGPKTGPIVLDSSKYKSQEQEIDGSGKRRRQSKQQVPSGSTTRGKGFGN